MFEKIYNKIGLTPLAPECSITTKVISCGDYGKCNELYGFGFTDQVVQVIDKNYGTLCDEYTNSKCCVFGNPQ
ncbi:hypothetical protein [Brevibacillus fortis]|uniref:hypothetical protein n=1 Tax=Brevibacillus fortis TaxID=2126352 RepID=UPI0038FC67D3